MQHGVCPINPLRYCLREQKEPDMNFTRSALEGDGLVGWLSVADIRQKLDICPSSPGVYVVNYRAGTPIIFLEKKLWRLVQGKEPDCRERTAGCQLGRLRRSCVYRQFQEFARPPKAARGFRGREAGWALGWSIDLAAAQQGRSACCLEEHSEPGFGCRQGRTHPGVS